MIQKGWPSHLEFKAINVQKVNLRKVRKSPAWDMSTSTTHEGKAKQYKAKQSETKPRFLKTKECTIFSVVTANFWQKKKDLLISDSGKRGILITLLVGEYVHNL